MRFEKCDLDTTKLPTRRHVIEYLLFVKHTGTSSVRKNQKLQNHANYVAGAIIELWQRTRIPIISRQNVRKSIVTFAKIYKDMLHHPEQYHEINWNELFMISRCKCFLTFTRNTCNCFSERAIPESEKPFFFDQCGPRLLSLTDNATTESVDDVDMPFDDFPDPTVTTVPIIPTVSSAVSTM